MAKKKFKKSEVKEYYEKFFQDSHAILSTLPKRERLPVLNALEYTIKHGNTKAANKKVNKLSGDAQAAILQIATLQVDFLNRVPQRYLGLIG